MRFYVTMTWHGFPEGGTYGAVIEAANATEAEADCRLEMANHGFDPECDKCAEDLVKQYENDWHVVDCFDLDAFIAEHTITAEPAEPPPENPFKIDMACSHCGSRDVRADAYAEWDVDGQTWELSTTFDNKVCEDCGGEASLDEVYADEDVPWSLADLEAELRHRAKQVPGFSILLDEVSVQLRERKGQ